MTSKNAFNEWRQTSEGPGSISELESIHLCADGTATEIEIEPAVKVADRDKVPDFRVRTRNWLGAR